MLKRTMLVTLTLSLVLVAGSAMAQLQCQVGAFANSDGTGSVIVPQFEGNRAVFSVYIVQYVEDFTNAVAYGLNVPGLNSDIFVEGFTAAGPFADSQVNGETIEVRTGLGGCFLGFGGTPVLVAEHAFQVFSPTVPQRVLGVVGDSREAASNGGNTPFYSTCQSALLACDGVEVLMETPIAVESSSWGAVKSLYGE